MYIRNVPLHIFKTLFEHSRKCTCSLHTPLSFHQRRIRNLKKRKPVVHFRCMVHFESVQILAYIFHIKHLYNFFTSKRGRRKSPFKCAHCVHVHTPLSFNQRRIRNLKKKKTGVHFRCMVHFKSVQILAYIFHIKHLYNFFTSKGGRRKSPFKYANCVH